MGVKVYMTKLKTNSQKKKFELGIYRIWLRCDNIILKVDSSSSDIKTQCRRELAIDLQDSTTKGLAFGAHWWQGIVQLEHKGIPSKERMNKL